MDKYSDKTFASHIDGLARGYKIVHLTDLVGGSLLAKLWGTWMDYTVKSTLSEGLHAGKQIKFQQFIDDAWESWVKSS
jgi:hypothetical protein